MSISTYRRRSIFWALVLIGLGVLFLWQDINPAVRPWNLIATFWPLLLVFWGVSKLVVYFEERTQPQAPPLFSPSEGVLLILILIFGTLASRIVLKPWHEWPRVLGVSDHEFAELFLNSYPFTSRLSQEIKKSSSLLIVNRRGNVNVHGSDQSEINGLIHETIWAGNEAAAKHLADRLKFNFVEHSGQYELESNLSALPYGGWTVRLDLLLQAPGSTSADLTTSRGDVIIDGLSGDQTLIAQHGDARAANIEGSVHIQESAGSSDVHNIRGNVDIEGRGGDVGVERVTGNVTVEGEFSGALRFRQIAHTLRFSSTRSTLNVQNLTGQLTMDLRSVEASGVKGPIELVTRDKDISLEDFRDAVKITNVNGNVRLQTVTPPRRPIQVDLKNGNINLALPAASGFEIEAVSRNGEVSCDFPGLQISREQGRPSIRGTYGAGGPLIRLVSTYGTIRVTREATPLPAAASAPAGAGPEFRTPVLSPANG